jgi:hypothetical protein
MQLQSRAVAGAAAGDAAGAAEAAAGGRYRSSYQAMLSILREDGPRGFYRGLVPRHCAGRLRERKTEGEGEGEEEGKRSPRERGRESERGGERGGREGGGEMEREIQAIGRWGPGPRVRCAGIRVGIGLTRAFESGRVHGADHGPR